MKKTATETGALALLDSLLDGQPKLAFSDPAAMAEEQRKQDLHTQQMQFADDKHQLELQRLQMQAQQMGQQFQMKQDHSQQKQDTANQDHAESQTLQHKAMAQQQGQTAAQQTAQAQHQHRANLSGQKKTAGASEQMMSQTSEQVVCAILEKIAARNEKPGDISSFLAAGGGIGAAVGGGGGLLQSIPRIKQLIHLQGKLPEQEMYNLDIRKQLRGIRKIDSSVKRMRTRSILNDLLGLPKPPNDIRKENHILRKMRDHVPAQDYHHLRKGYEEGIVGRSRTTKTTKALKRVISKNVLKKGLIGLGVGLGGGLLGATAVGHLDK